MLHRIVEVALLSMVPWVELRLSIPLGIARWHLHPLVAMLCAVAASWAVIVPMFLILDLFYNRFLARVEASRIPWVRSAGMLVHRGVEEIRRGGRSYVERYGVLGIGIYVSLPLPGPGVYSGVILAWLFGLPRRQAIVALALGILVSAILVTAISTGVIAVIRNFR